MLLEGKLTAAGRRAGTRQIASPAALGFEEVLEGCPLADTVRTVETSVALTLSSDEFRTLLADNTDLVQGFFRTLADRRAARVPPVLRGTSGKGISPLASAHLTPIEKVLALQQIPVFSKIPAEEMLNLAAIAWELPLEAGQVLSGDADPPVLCMVLSGELAVYSSRDDDKPLMAGPGDAVGIYETLAGTESGAIGRDPFRLVVTQGGTALKIDREDLFDLFGQRSDLLPPLFSALFEAPAAGA